MKRDLPETYIIYETESGIILLSGGVVILSRKLADGEDVQQAYSWVVERARERGIQSISVANEAAERSLAALGIEAGRLTEEEKRGIEADKPSLMVKAGFASTEQEAIALIKERALKIAEQAISEQSSRQDLHLVHAIQSLDEIDKSLNITLERIVEWYSLHFPELPSILQDNLGLAKLVLEVGRRDGFDDDKLSKSGLSQKKVEAIMIARDRSKGGTISDRDMGRVNGLCEIALLLSSDRDKLAEYVESTMKRIAPNVGAVAGSTIGARLIARAGGLDRLARLPASTIQILGAEKALFRALRTGARPPKHGILFQHQAVHTAPKWQRGKIARTIANKVAIGARVDFYRGESEGSLPILLDKRIEEIRLKYKEPRIVPEIAKRKKSGEPFLRGKRRKEKPRYQESSAGRKGLRRGPRRD